MLQVRREGSHRSYRHRHRGVAHFLKSDSDCNLCAVQCGLIDEAGRVVVIIKNPVSSLGKDVPSDLASNCAVALTGNLRSDSKAAHITFGGQVERLAEIISPAYTDKRIEPVG
jgi:hypothetical protein